MQQFFFWVITLSPSYQPVRSKVRRIKEVPMTYDTVNSFTSVCLGLASLTTDGLSFPPPPPDLVGLWFIPGGWRKYVVCVCVWGGGKESIAPRSYFSRENHGNTEFTPLKLGPKEWSFWVPICRHSCVHWTVFGYLQFLVLKSYFEY